MEYHKVVLHIAPRIIQLDSPISGPQMVSLKHPTSVTPEINQLGAKGTYLVDIPVV